MVGIGFELGVPESLKILVVDVLVCFLFLPVIQKTVLQRASPSQAKLHCVMSGTERVREEHTSSHSQWREYR